MQTFYFRQIIHQTSQVFQMWPKMLIFFFMRKRLMVMFWRYGKMLYLTSNLSQKLLLGRKWDFFFRIICDTKSCSEPRYIHVNATILNDLISSNFRGITELYLMNILHTLYLWFLWRGSLKRNENLWNNFFACVQNVPYKLS
jgi:hypothetical protein